MSVVDVEDELDVEERTAVIVENDPLTAELDPDTELEAAAPAGEEVVDDDTVMVDEATILKVAVIGLETAELEDWLDPAEELGLTTGESTEVMLDARLEIDELLAEEADDAEELLNCDTLEEDRELEKTLLAEDDADEEEADDKRDEEADNEEELD